MNRKFRTDLLVHLLNRNFNIYAAVKVGSIFISLARVNMLYFC